MGRFVEVVLMSSALLIPLSAGGAHFLGHGQTFEPSQQEVSQFCNKRYPEISRSPQYSAQQKQETENLYKQYCLKQPVPEPAQPSGSAKPEQPGKPDAIQGRIDRIEGPSCAERGAEFRVRGSGLRRAQLSCRLQSDGRRRTLNAYSRTDGEYRFRLDKLPAAAAYRFECEVPGDRDTMRLQACPSPQEQPDGTDLAPQISAGGLRPGETQIVEVSLVNRGRSQPGNRRHRLTLVLADRDLSRTGASRMSAALTPSAGQVLAHKRQWVMRVPGSGAAERVPVAMSVPARLPDGETLYWCALADSDDGIPEANERNNLECVPASEGGGIVARKDLAGVFGSAVRSRDSDLIDQAPEPQLDSGDDDGASQPRLLMEDDAGVPLMALPEIEGILPVDALLDFNADALLDPSVLLRLGDAYFTDLSIIAVQRVASGPHRGKLLIAVKAQPVGGDRPAQAEFPVVVRDESGELWSGSGRVKPMLLGWGDWIITDYVPRGPEYLTVEINRSPVTYDEGGNTHNNTVAKAFNWDRSPVVRPMEPLPAEQRTVDDSPTTIWSVTRTEHGPDWSRLRVDYSIAPNRRCRVLVVASRPGPSSMRGDPRVRCEWGGFQSGRATEAEFLCRVKVEVIGVDPFRAQETAGLECQDDDPSGSLRSTIAREWQPRPDQHTPQGPRWEELGDYFIPFADVRYRDGKPVRLTVNVSVITSPGVLLNDWLMPNLTVEAVTADRTVIARTYRVPRVGTRIRPELGTHTIDLREGNGWSWSVQEPGSAVDPSWIRISIDNDVVQRLGGIASTNNSDRIDLDRVHPVAVLWGTL